MSRKIIDNGSAPDAGDGEGLYYAFGKANDNFEELYGRFYEITGESPQEFLLKTRPWTKAELLALGASNYPGAVAICIDGDDSQSPTVPCLVFSLSGSWYVASGGGVLA